MGYIASFFAERFVTNAPPELDKGELRKLVGLAADASPSSDQMILDSDFFRLLEKIAAFGLAGRSIAVTVGSGMRCDDYGAFGLAFKSAETLLNSFHRVERFGKVVTSIANYEVLSGSNSAFMRVLPGDQDRLGLHMTNELAVAAAVALSREVSTGSVRPDYVSFSHPAPKKILSSFTDFFGCSVRFDADTDGFQTSEETLGHPNRLGDAKTSEFFDTHLESELATLKNDTGLERRVRIQVAFLLSEGVPVLTDVAIRLGMSDRSLQRRLSERGYAYQDIVDEARRELAERLLTQTEYSLAEIAFLTGYSEQSAFTKAFRRWRGQTPRSYRLDVQSNLH